LHSETTADFLEGSDADAERLGSNVERLAVQLLEDRDGDGDGLALRAFEFQLRFFPPWADDNLARDRQPCRRWRARLIRPKDISF